MIYRDFPTAAYRFARRGKPKTAAVDKHFVVVISLDPMVNGTILDGRLGGSASLHVHGVHQSRQRS